MEKELSYLKKALITLGIIGVVVAATLILLALINYRAAINNPKSYKNVYAKELSTARELLEDSRSEAVFDKAAAVRNRIVSLKVSSVGQADFEHYFHPLVPINPGDIIIDAGAGWGDNSWGEPVLTFSKQTGENGKIIGFEPHPAEFKKLSEYLKTSGIKNVELYKLGLWSKPETLRLGLANSSSSLFKGLWAPDNAETVHIKLVRLDDFVKEHKIKKIDFIKMDIEGAELNALLGGEDTLRKYKPKLAISVYHMPEHLFTIILWLDSLDLGYKFWLDSHTEHFITEVVLYAKVDEPE